MNAAKQFFDDSNIVVSTNDIQSTIDQYLKHIDASNQNHSNDVDFLTMMYRKIIISLPLEQRIQTLTEINKRTIQENDSSDTWCEDQFVRILAHKDVTDAQMLHIWRFVEESKSKSLMQLTIESVIQGLEAQGADQHAMVCYIFRFLLLGKDKCSDLHNQLLEYFKSLLNTDQVDDLLKMYMDYLFNISGDEPADVSTVCDYIIDWLYKNGSGSLQNFIEITVQTIQFMYEASEKFFKYFVEKICSYAYQHNVTRCVGIDGNILLNDTVCTTCEYNIRTLLLVLSRHNDSSLNIDPALEHVFEHYNFDSTIIKLCIDNINATIEQDAEDLLMCMRMLKIFHRHYPEIVVSQSKKTPLFNNFKKFIVAKQSETNKIKESNHVKHKDCSDSESEDEYSQFYDPVYNEYLKWIIECNIIDVKIITDAHLIELSQPQSCMMCIIDTCSALKSCSHPICSDCFIFGMYLKSNSSNNPSCHTCKLLKDAEKRKMKKEKKLKRKQDYSDSEMSEDSEIGDY